VARRRFLVRRWLAPYVTWFVAVSETLRRRLETEVGIDPAKIRVVLNTADPSRFVPVADRVAVRGELGYAADAILVGSVGRLDAVKQFDVLLEAFAQVHASNPRVRLVLVGDGPQRPALEAMVQRLGLSDAVRLPGQQADVRPWLGAMDLFVLPSAREGISRAALEAMASGLPVIASDVSGNCEILRDTDAGMLVAAGDVAALAVAMRRCCDDAPLRQRLGEAARQRVIDVFSVDAAVRAYTQLYLQLLTPALSRESAGEGISREMLDG
jgi:glycosyltransferase involved in cell wall biosynthesis